MYINVALQTVEFVCEETRAQVSVVHGNDSQ